MKKIYIILITIIGITVVIITSCILSIYIGDSKNEDNTLQFQNQFLKDFGIDFIETKHKKDSFIQNEFGVFFEIELSQTERIQMDRYVKDNSSIFLPINNEMYPDILQYVNENYKAGKEIIEIDSGYYSFFENVNKEYNKTNSLLADFVFLEYKDGILYIYQCDA